MGHNWQNPWHTRLGACVKAKDAHFEHILSQLCQNVFVYNSIVYYIFLVIVINFHCLLKVYTIKAKEFGSYIHSCLFLQGSAAAELGRGGKFYSVLGCR